MNDFFVRNAIRIIFIFPLFLLFSTVEGQLSEDGIPYSYKGRSYLKSAVDLPEYTLRSQDVQALKYEDEINGTPNRYSTFEDVSIDILKEGVVTDIPEEDGRIWRYRVTGEQATSIQLYFSVFDLPPAASLFIYDEDYNEIYGAFTNRNNRADNTLMIADFAGSSVIIEYFERYNSAYEGQLKIGSVGQGYRAFEKLGTNEDADGYINVNCSEGALWQNEKHAVCRISFQIDSNGYLCSGAFINNVNNDGTPYFLTANHCISAEEIASTAIVFFNYEIIGCNGNVKPFATLSGATLKATAPETDYTLLQFIDTPPPDYQPYYAGWNVSGESGESNVGIHHPTGKTKKISIADSAAISINSVISWEDDSNTPPDSHWGLIFDKGKTSGGSSGSPLFNDKGQIIGQLHGGDELADFYGKIDYSWRLETETGKTLQSFLDPDSTNIASVDGYYPAENLSDPFFYTAFSNVCDSAGITLIDYSAFQPTAWDWSFSPNDVTFLEGTNAQSNNPVVAFNNDTVPYDVIMSVTNQGGEKSQIYRKVISAGDELEIETYPYTPVDSCLLSFDSLSLISAGTESYSWSLANSSIENFAIVNDTLDRATVIMTQRPDTVITMKLYITGYHGKCLVDTSYSLKLNRQFNDSIHTAIEISLGKNGAYSNICAGIEDSEPVPPFTSCTGQDSWCDEYGTGEDIVENSVWFYFIPEASGTYELSSKGMDNQIAVYQATDKEALLSGNYTLVGANDDFTSIDFNPKIENLELIEDALYWIQVDGSAGGAEGRFFLNMELIRLLSVEKFYSKEEINVYPQPALDRITIEWETPVNHSELKVNIFDATGRIIFQNSYDSGQKKFEVDVSDWSRGVYFIKLDNGDFRKSVKMIK